jgi:predicted metalloprotease
VTVHLAAARCAETARLAALVAALVVVAACTSVVSGRGGPAPVAVADLCRGGVGAPAAVSGCVTADVQRWWTAQVGRPVRLTVSIDPAPGTVHRACADFLAFGTAFYCPPDGTVYVTGAAVARDRREFGTRWPYALAVILAHEAGHRVQHVLDLPGLAASDDAGSRRLEQQADCLAGVWARDAARRGRLEPTTFRDVLRRELTVVGEIRPPPGSGLEEYDEVATHGTVPERLAAYDRGYAGGPDSCGLRLPAR